MPRLSQHRHEVVSLHRVNTDGQFDDDTLANQLKKGQRQVSLLNLVLKMSKTQFKRDDILNSSERSEAGRKCLKILASVDADEMSEGNRKFYLAQDEAADRLNNWEPSERQLAWLRDLVEKYAC